MNYTTTNQNTAPAFTIKENAFDSLLKERRMDIIRKLHLVRRYPETRNVNKADRRNPQIHWDDIPQMPLAEGLSYSLDCYETLRNNNVFICGTPGSGKTRGIIEPQIKMATGSYVISDPKRNLYSKYHDYLEARGYDVFILDFTDPLHSECFNPLAFIHNSQDVIKIAHTLAYANGTMATDPFWDQSAELIISALIALLWESDMPEYLTIENLALAADALEQNVSRTSSSSNNRNSNPIAAASSMNERKNGSLLEEIIKNIESHKGVTFATKRLKRFMAFSEKTRMSVLGSVYVKLAAYESDELNRMLCCNSLTPKLLGEKKCAIFVSVSDTDRSMDTLANLFYDSCMKELVDHADKECSGCSLPVPVRFLLDDFGTNVRIEGFEKMIASIRSRNISTMLVVQANGQVENAYQRNAETIINSCDTYVYLGGLDEATAAAISRKCNIPLKKVLFMPVSKCWVLRRGEDPVFSDRLDIADFEKIREFSIENDRIIHELSNEKEHDIMSKAI